MVEPTQLKNKYARQIGSFPQGVGMKIKKIETTTTQTMVIWGLPLPSPETNQIAPENRPS